MPYRKLLKLILLASASTAMILAQKNTDHWVVTWATAPMIYRPAPGQVNGGGPPPFGGSGFAGGRGAAGFSAGRGAAGFSGGRRGGGFNRGPQSFNNQTIRMIAHTSIGGRRIRLELTNPFGGSVVNVGSAHVAIRDKDSAIVPATDRVMTFGGSRTFQMLPGATLVSDPVDLGFSALADLAVSLYFPTDTGLPPNHLVGVHTTYISTSGDFAAQAAITGGTTTTASYWISAIDVLAPANSFAVVALGDSITDGDKSTVDGNDSWPALLATRLQHNKATTNVAVANSGIAGNRVLADSGGSAGVAVLARLDHDVLALPGAKWVIFLEGINDIGGQARRNTGLTADDLIVAMRQIVARAHTHGLRIAGCTITPYEGAAYYSGSGEAIRTAVNTFIRTPGSFDAVVDFDAAVRDPANPKRFRADMQSGDNLHPSDAGYQKMADAIDLSIFTK